MSLLNSTTNVTYQPVTAQAQATPQMRVDDTFCSCIKTARYLGVPIPLGTNAEDLQPNGTPNVGDLLLFKYKVLYHIAVVVERNDKEEYYLVKEGNYEKCQMTTRKVLFSDPAIRGGWRYSSGDE